jgi:hypothetical protein
VLFTGGNNIQNLKIKSILEKHFILDSNPPHDFVVYGDYEYQYLKYDCIRIHYCVELGTADFELDDYVIGYDYLNFGDRHIRYPYYLFRDSSISALYETKNIQSAKDFLERGFCSYLTSNPLAMSNRDKLFELLSCYKKVNSGGGHLNNLDYIVVNKLDFLSKHKFNIAAENSIYDGNTTEKIVDAFEANTIPIYIGNPLIELEFNPKSFINSNNFDSHQDLVDYVKKIDNNDIEYMKMLAEPKILETSLVPKEIELESFLLRIFLQDPLKARRRPVSQKTIVKERTMTIYQIVIRERSWKLITSIIDFYSILPIAFKKFIRRLL